MTTNNGLRINRRIGALAFAASATAALMTLPALSSAQSTTFSMSPTRSRLVVLLHGVTSEPFHAPGEAIGTALHGRFYWGEDFIRGLMGTTQDGQTDVLQPTWGGKTYLDIMAKGTWNVPLGMQNYTFEKASSSLAPIVIPKPAGLWFPGTTITNESTILNVLAKQGEQSANPTTSVMVTHRDGSQHLMPQVGAAITQIYTTYMRTYGKLPVDRQPQMYLVGHSFGGIIARAIASNPTGADLYGNRLTPEQRTQADFIRQRTVLITTMAAPHLGTPIPKLTQDVAAYIRGFESKWNEFFDTANPPSAPGSFNLGVKEAIISKGRSFFGMALDTVAGERDCIKDLQRMDEYNRGILHPSLARRTPNGTLIPIYTMGGRSPGNMFIDRDRSFDPLGIKSPYDSTDLISMDGQGNNAISLHGISSLLYRKGYGKEGKRPYGTALVAEGDKVASPYRGIGPSAPRNQSLPFDLTLGDVKNTLLDTLYAGPYVAGSSDGEYDSDGFVGFDSAHGLSLAGEQWYRLYPKNLYGGWLPWDIDHHGSMMHNIGNGLWIKNELLDKAGFIVSNQSNRQSLFPLNGIPVTPKVNIRLEIESVTDMDGDLDYGSQADFWIGARIADKDYGYYCPENRSVVAGTAFEYSDFRSTVVPIRINIAEIDVDANDPCATTSKSGRDNIYIYLDTRTGRIFGDAEGQAGELLTERPHNDIDNRVQVKFRVKFAKVAG